MKNVLLLVHDDAGQEARLQVALDLTRRLDGHLTCVDVAVPQIPIGDVNFGATPAILVDYECEREAANKARLQTRLAHEGVAWNWIDTIGTIAEGVLQAAELADIIVLNRQLESGRNPDMRDIASRIVMHARKPIVAVPETLTRFHFDRALVAWDGRASSADTMRISTPLLALAKDVEIFMVRNRATQMNPSEAAEYLSRHGISANVVVIEDDHTAADKLIEEECQRWHADYVVMGAYGRGRLREVFGGITKRMLAGSKYPLIMGH